MAYTSLSKPTHHWTIVGLLVIAVAIAFAVKMFIDQDDGAGVQTSGMHATQVTSQPVVSHQQQPVADVATAFDDASNDNVAFNQFEHAIVDKNMLKKSHNTKLNQDFARQNYQRPTNFKTLGTSNIILNKLSGEHLPAKSKTFYPWGSSSSFADYHAPE